MKTYGIVLNGNSLTFFLRKKNVKLLPFRIFQYGGRDHSGSSLELPLIKNAPPSAIEGGAW